MAQNALNEYHGFLLNGKKIRVKPHKHEAEKKRQCKEDQHSSTSTRADESDRCYDE